MKFAVVAPLLLASLSAVRAQSASKGSKKAKNTKSGKTTPPEDECQENGYEVWQPRPNDSVSLKLDTTVDTDMCTYELSLSFKPDPDLPILNSPTADDFLGMPQEEYTEKCAAQGFFENAVNNTLSAEHHVGLNDLYTDYAYSLELSDRAAESIGFKLATLGAGPCGTFLQDFPQYSIHFYTITVEERKQMKCLSDGGYFCKSYENQCSESGRKFLTNGVGLETCPDWTPPGFPQYKNLPVGYAWSIDGSLPIAGPGVNAASPGMGLHGVDPAEFADGRDDKIPFTLMVNYDNEVIANHVLIWAGAALGESPELLPYTKDTPVYNCQSEDKKFMPTRTVVDYDEDSTYTSITISGQLLDCSGSSYTEVDDSSHTSKASKSRSTGKSKSVKSAKAVKTVAPVEVVEEIVEEVVGVFD